MNRQTILPGITCFFVLSAAMSAHAGHSDRFGPTSFTDVTATLSNHEHFRIPVIDDFLPDGETAPARTHTDVPDLPRSEGVGFDPMRFISPEMPGDKIDFGHTKYKWSLRPYGAYDPFAQPPRPDRPAESVVFGGEPDWLLPKLYRDDGSNFVRPMLPQFQGESLVLNDSLTRGGIPAMPTVAFAIPTPATSVSLLLGLSAACRRRRER